MAKKKKKIRIDRLIIVILVGLILLGGLGFGAYKLISMLVNKNDSQIKPTVDPSQPIVTSEGVKLSIEDYDVYYDDTDKMGFNFVLATIKFEANEPVSFDLKNLQTSEKIYLNDVSKYTKKLEDNAYNLTKLNIKSVVATDEKSATINLFIPFTTTSSYLNIYNSLDATKLQFDLNKNIKEFALLKLNTNEEIAIEDDKNNGVSVVVSNSYISEMMLHNGQEFNAEAFAYYTFEIEVTKLEGNVMLTDAKFVKADSDTSFTCLDQNYSSIKSENIIGKKLSLGDNGALFFEVPGRGSIDYSGQLLLLFSNSNEWICIPTTLD